MILLLRLHGARQLDVHVLRRVLKVLLRRYGLRVISLDVEGG